MDQSNNPMEGRHSSSHFTGVHIVIIFILIALIGAVGYLGLNLSRQKNTIKNLQTAIEKKDNEQVRDFPHCPADNTAPHCENKIVSPKTTNECIDASMQVVSTSPLECVSNNKAFPNNRINDGCFDWQFPPDIEILRYDPCSSLSLFKYENGREFKANFVLTRPIIGGEKDVFGGVAEQVMVESNTAMRYIHDLSEDTTGLGTYSIDYTVNYDRLPLKTPRNGKELLTAEFQLATKNDLTVSLFERNAFVDTVDTIMDALETK